jgi:uncharacterized phage protein gp47/JayE
MADLPTRQELFARARAAALATPGTRISAREIDRAGSDANLLFAAMSLLGEEVVNRMARAVAGCFEDTASVDALDRVIFDRKGLPRKPAAPAVGEIQLTRPTFAAGGGTIDGTLPGGTPAPTRIRTNSGISYLITSPAVFGPTSLGPITVPIQAELAGIDSEVDELQSWSFVDTIFDTSIVIANAEATAGAADEETDSEYRARAKDFFRTIRRGTLGAIEFGLRSTPGIASVSVLEIDNEEGEPACSVQAFILDSLGRANETLAARGLLELLEYRAAGIPVIVVPGVPDFIDIQILLSFDSSVVNDTSQAADDVRSAIVAALNNQIPGQLLYRTTILAAARSVAGVIVEDTDLIEPAGTLVPSDPSIVFRTRRELISTT